MIRIRTAVLGAALIIGVSATTAAQQGSNTSAERGAMGARRSEAKRMLFRDINLSEAQQTQLKSIREKYEVQARAVRDSSRGSRESSQQGDTTGARKARKGSRQGRRYSGELMQKAHAEMRGILTAEQQTVFDRNVAELQKKHEQKSKRRGKEGGRKNG
ncbi:MAG: Spy/CpxP family protein refolding chaperone [Anaerolineae bacterium]|nr:Spy/CpxP family protein refolding chaperone [Gemmatimonadaceae bacterium]